VTDPKLLRRRIVVVPPKRRAFAVSERGVEKHDDARRQIGEALAARALAIALERLLEHGADLVDRARDLGPSHRAATPNPDPITEEGTRKRRERRADPAAEILCAVLPSRDGRHPTWVVPHVSTQSSD
jgi:hypothetical protein